MSLLASPFPWLALGAAGILLALRAWPRLSEAIDIIGRLALLALPVVLALTTLATLLMLILPLPETIRPALIAALVVVAGWIVTFLFQELGRTRDQTDLMLALRAEIFIIRNQLDPATTRVYMTQLSDQFDAAILAGSDFRPFVTMPADATVFEGLRGQISRLPSEVVDEVIQFYSLLSDLTIFAADLRSDHFRTLPMDRARHAYADYYETRLALADYADAALDVLNTAIGASTRNGLLKTGQRSPAAVQSDQKSSAAVSENNP